MYHEFIQIYQYRPSILSAINGHLSFYRQIHSFSRRRNSSDISGHFNTPTTVYFSQDEATKRTVLELVSADQPGLLSMIGRVFHKRRILLDAAKIATIGERAEDVFFVTTADHAPITDPGVLEDLREVLIRTLSDAEPTKPSPKKNERD